MSKHWLVLSAALAIGAGCASMDKHADREDESNETKVNFADAPAPVRQTLTAQAPGATIKTVDHEMHHGMWVYEADAMVGGKNWEIVVAEDGKLISKKVDNEDNEQGEMEDDEKK